MKHVSFFILLLFNLNSITAQASYTFAFDEIKKEKILEDNSETNYKFEFPNFEDEKEWKSIPTLEAGTHYLGDSIAKKFSLVQKLYTFQTTFSPGNPAVRTVIQKPLIYNAISKLDKYFKKNLRQESCSIEAATKMMNHALNVAIVVYAQNSEDFERVLKNSKKTEELVKVFSGTTLTRR